MARVNELRPAAASWRCWLVQAGGMGGSGDDDGDGDCVVTVTVVVVVEVIMIEW